MSTLVKRNVQNDSCRRFTAIWLLGSNNSNFVKQKLRMERILKWYLYKIKTQNKIKKIIDIFCSLEGVKGIGEK